MTNAISSLAYILLYLITKISTQKSSMYQITDQIKNDILKWHNYYRDQVARGNVTGQPAGKIDKLEYDDDLAKFAYNYLDNSIKKNNGKCPTGHNPDHCFYHGSTVDAVGENIAWDAVMDVGRGVKNWFDEHTNYKYAKSPEGKIKPDMDVGHYTQVVAARSKKVGCAIAQDCDTFKMMLLCNYMPAGNMNGEYPYTDKDIAKNGSMDSCQMKENQKNNWDSASQSLKNGAASTGATSAGSRDSTAMSSTTPTRMLNSSPVSVTSLTASRTSSRMMQSGRSTSSSVTQSGASTSPPMMQPGALTSPSMTQSGASKSPPMTQSGASTSPSMTQSGASTSPPMTLSGASTSSLMMQSGTWTGSSTMQSRASTSVTEASVTASTNAVTGTPASTSPTLPVCPFAAQDAIDEMATEEPAMTTTVTSRPLGNIRD
uniref:SCP domain-containing protein n=1 Tax=Romanomermis culicivorax TaxID=13658 RepID=A0A915HTL7_ROMCU